MGRVCSILPENLSIDGKVVPEQRRRGLFAVTVYSTAFDVVAEFSTKAEQWIDWTQAHLTLGLSDIKSIEAATVNVDGQQVEWVPDASALVSLQAPLAAAALANRDTFTVRFHVVFAGSGSLSMVPMGRRTEATIASTWPSPSFMGRYLPASQAVDKDGFRATWSISYLGEATARSGTFPVPHGRPRAPCSSRPSA